VLGSRGASCAEDNDTGRHRVDRATTARHRGKKEEGRRGGYVQPRVCERRRERATSGDARRSGSHGILSDVNW